MQSGTGTAGRDGSRQADAGQADAGPVSRRRLLGGLAAGVPLMAMSVPLLSGSAAARPSLAQAGRDVRGGTTAGRAETTAQKDWALFKQRFIAPEGRVVDTGNNNVSHSEGQGIGMLSAVHFDDQEMFDHLAAWTNQHLIRATDHLYAWRYRPDQPMPVDDPNNATDGDMLIAWAMFEAARKWNNPIYRSAAWDIANNIRSALVRPMGDRLVLLPGTFGFVHADRTVVNPSYYVFPALHRFATDMPDPVWAQLWKDGIGLLREARYGRWGLTPDWISLNSPHDNPRIADGWPARFSWDAVRVPLYMSWVGLAQEPAVTGAVDFWTSYPVGDAPAWTDLQDGAVAPYRQNCGLHAVQAFSVAAQRGHDAVIPSAASAQDYYAAALTLLAHIANATKDSYSAPIV